jgi:hypothetical protein
MHQFDDIADARTLLEARIEEVSGPNGLSVEATRAALSHRLPVAA